MDPDLGVEIPCSDIAGDCTAKSNWHYWQLLVEKGEKAVRGVFHTGTGKPVFYGFLVVEEAGQ